MTTIQGSVDWLAERCGFLTASVFADVMAAPRSGESAGRKNLRAKLVAERMTGKPQDSFTGTAMQWGTDTEPLARAAYEMEKGVLVDEIGFVKHARLKWAGASPDGLVGKDGLVEIKCPNTATHIEYLIERKPPRKYLLQMHWQMACASRGWCDFVSFDPRMPLEHQLMCVRVERDENLILEMESAAIVFLCEVEETIDRINGLGATNSRNQPYELAEQA